MGEEDAIWLDILQCWPAPRAEERDFFSHQLAQRLGAVRTRAGSATPTMIPSRASLAPIVAAGEGASSEAEPAFRVGVGYAAREHWVSRVVMSISSASGVRLFRLCRRQASFSG